MTGKNTTHKPAFMCYCELALKSAGLRITHAGGSLRTYVLNIIYYIALHRPAPPRGGTGVHTGVGFWPAGRGVFWGAGFVGPVREASFLWNRPGFAAQSHWHHDLPID